jgi:HEAT repeat protein
VSVEAHELDGVDRIDSRELLARAVQLASVDESRDSDEYWRAIRRLHKRPEREVFDRAAVCCASSVPVERLVGADVLAQIGDAAADGSRPFTHESVPMLRALLFDSDESVIASAVHALAHHRRASAADVGRLARHESANIRWAVAGALDGQDPEALAILIDLTTDVDVDVRDWATFAIGTQSDADGPAIRDALRVRLSDDDEMVRCEAMVGLARRRDAGVISHVVNALDRPDPDRLVFDAADEILAAWPQQESIKKALEKWRTR